MVTEEAHLAPAPAVSMAAQQEALRDGKIVGFRCNKDGYEQFSPMVRCPKCRGRDIEARGFSTTGKVVSYTIQSVASEQFMNETPFAFVIVKLDDGPKVSGWIPWVAKESDLPLGQAVQFTPSYKAGMMFEEA